MKAILEFTLPEDQEEHRSALAGTDALLLIDEVLEEVRNKLKYDSGFFKEWTDEEGTARKGDEATLDRMRELIVTLKRERNIPELS